MVPHYRPWYEGAPRQTVVENLPENWYVVELANFMHFRKNEQKIVGSKWPQVGTLTNHCESPETQEEKEALTLPYVGFWAVGRVRVIGGVSIILDV